MINFSHRFTSIFKEIKMKNIKKSELIAVVNEAHNKFRGDNSGANASYIPYLANVDSSLFGIAVALPSGEVVAVGDTHFVLGVESISKVHTAILALQQNGAMEVLDKIGADATGMPFNSIMAILLENDKPSTPLVNSGAIAAVSMINPTGDSDKKWNAILGNMNALTGSKLSVIEELYRSETDTNYNNRSIAWLLKNYDRIYDEPELALDLYTRQCSVGVTVADLAITGATIAGAGRNPVTGEEVFDSSISPKIISLIATVGFYEHTGDWIYRSGIPAKTGVGGGILGVVPSASSGGFGIAAFSPPLDSSGNSVRAQKSIEYIANRLDINIFNGEIYNFD